MFSRKRNRTRVAARGLAPPFPSVRPLSKLSQGRERTGRAGREGEWGKEIREEGKNGEQKASMVAG